MNVNWNALFQFMEYLDSKGFYIMPHKREEIIRAETKNSIITFHSNGKCVFTDDINSLLKKEIREKWVKLQNMH